jgi:hypothetical protein
VDEAIDLAEELVQGPLSSGLLEHVEHALRRIRWRGRRLVEVPPGLILDQTVGERPADVDRDPHRSRRSGSLVPGNMRIYLTSVQLLFDPITFPPG